MKRRELLKVIGSTVIAGVALPAGILLGQSANALNATDSAGSILSASSSIFPDVVWVENGEPEQLLAAALKEMGGMSRFVSKGDVVVVKPNIGWDRSPEQAANTNPKLIAEIVKEVLKAGAKKVKVFDRTCNNPRRCYENSGIRQSAEDAGAEVTNTDDSRFVKVELKKGEILKEWSIYKDYLEADKVINVPIAKNHGLSTVTLGLKNLMGVMGGQRGEIHSPFNKLIDIVEEILPTLTIIDAYRVLMKNGPQGGELNDVKLAKTLLMSPCTLAADMSALPLFELPADKKIEYLQKAAERGLNKIDLKSINLKKVVL
ncbi:MAG: DUF362 domain-containing protein [Candidatus Riflebacteria bacterium]|nr:DUF362 domain-containing protein [Candidatus Riflebacteria bacterium]